MKTPTFYFRCTPYRLSLMIDALAAQLDESAFKKAPIKTLKAKQTRALHQELSKHYDDLLRAMIPHNGLSPTINSNSKFKSMNSQCPRIDCQGEVEDIHHFEKTGELLCVSCNRPAKVSIAYFPLKGE